MAKGLDIGTGNTLALWNENDKVIHSGMRDCYIEIDDDDDFLEAQGQLPLVTIGSKKVVLGEDAIKIANWIKSPVKRPMRLGVVNPLDNMAVNVLEAIIAKVLGTPKEKGEICVGSIPANSFDESNDIVVHQQAANDIITKLGYEFHPINEGYATLLALNPVMKDEEGNEMPNSGIAFSFGAGQTNACLGFRSKDLLTLSVARGGDYIDEKVAATFENVKPNQVTSFKEKFFSFGKNYTEAEMEAVGYKTPERKEYFEKMMKNLNAYYEDLIRYVIAAFTKKFTEEELNIQDALEIVIAGGTSSPAGFEEKFSEILAKSSFPLNIHNVRKADKEKILICTATGALIWAQHLTKKKQKQNISPIVANPTPLKPLQE